MRKKIQYILVLALFPLLNSCGIYNFTGAGPIKAKSFQVNYFQNVSELIEPGMERDFTQRLQNLIQNQTNLNLTNANADLLYEGEIVEYRISPMTATANSNLSAAQNRLTVTVNVRFSDKNDTTANFEKRFSFFYDYPADQQLTGGTRKAAFDEIFERITQDIFTASLAKW